SSHATRIGPTWLPRTLLRRLLGALSPLSGPPDLVTSSAKALVHLQPFSTLPFLLLPFFSETSALFSQLSLKNPPTTPLESAICALFQKQRRGCHLISSPHSLLGTRHLASTPLATARTQKITSLESAF